MKAFNQIIKTKSTHIEQCLKNAILGGIVKLDIADFDPEEFTLLPTDISSKALSDYNDRYNTNNQLEFYLGSIELEGESYINVTDDEKMASYLEQFHKLSISDKVCHSHNDGFCRAYGNITVMKPKGESPSESTPVIIITDCHDGVSGGCSQLLMNDAGYEYLKSRIL